MDELLLKRLQLEKIDEKDIRSNSQKISNRHDLFERREFFYLFNSLKRLKDSRNSLDDSHDFLFELCINVSKTIIELNNEDFDANKRLCLQLIDLINEYYDKRAEGKLIFIS